MCTCRFLILTVLTVSAPPPEVNLPDIGQVDSRPAIFIAPKHSTYYCLGDESAHALLHMYIYLGKISLNKACLLCLLP